MPAAAFMGLAAAINFSASGVGASKSTQVMAPMPQAPRRQADGLARAMRAERAVFCTAGSVPLPRLEFADSKRRFAAEVIGFTRRIEFRRAVRAGAFAHTAANAFF